MSIEHLVKNCKHVTDLNLSGCKVFDYRVLSYQLHSKLYGVHKYIHVRIYIVFLHCLFYISREHSVLIYFRTTLTD